MSKEKLRRIQIIIAVIVAISLYCLFFFVRQDFSLRGWSDAFFISGAILLGFGLLAFVAGHGLFDMMGYGMYRVVGAFKFKGELKYKTAESYKEKRLENRSKSPFFFQIYLIIGGVFIVAAIIFSILFFNVR